MNKITNLVLKNKNELFESKKKIISLKNSINKKDFYVKKINLISKKNNTPLKILKHKYIKMKLQEKIKKIDPWYEKICRLKKLPRNVKKLVMHTAYKNTLKCWYIYLTDKKKYLMQYDAWIILKNELHTITTKKIQLIIKKNNLHALTPYEWFHKICEEIILKEYLLLKKDPNIEILNKFFNIEFQKNNVHLI